MDSVYHANGGSAFFADSYLKKEPKQIRGLLNIEDDDLAVRIGICGAHGTGKSTLARRLSNELNIPLIEQVSRTVKGMGYRINKNSDVLSQVAIWLGQLHEQLEYEHFITDRTLIDHFSYASWLNEHKEFGIDKHIINAMGNITSNIVQSQYSVIFYLPISWSLKANGIRSTDKRYQQEIDELILRYLNSFDVEYIPLPGSSNKKLDVALNVITDSGLLDGLDDDDDEEDDA